MDHLTDGLLPLILIGFAVLAMGPYNSAEDARRKRESMRIQKLYEEEREILRRESKEK
jgi:hypothetical protein